MDSLSKACKPTDERNPWETGKMDADERGQGGQTFRQRLINADKISCKHLAANSFDQRTEKWNVNM